MPVCDIVCGMSVCVFFVFVYIGMYVWYTYYIERYAVRVCVCMCVCTHIYLYVSTHSERIHEDMCLNCSIHTHACTLEPTRK